MRRGGLALCVLLAALPPAGGGAAAAERVAMRAGDHAGHGRLVLDWAGGAGARLEEAGPGRFVLRFARPATFAPPPRLPRNLLALEPEADRLLLTLAPGARPRLFRLEGRVVLDIADPPSGGAAVAEAPSARPVAPRTAPSARPPEAAARAAGAAPRPAPEAAPRPAPEAAPRPATEAARRPATEAARQPATPPGAAARGTPAGGVAAQPVPRAAPVGVPGLPPPAVAGPALAATASGAPAGEAPPASVPAPGRALPPPGSPPAAPPPAPRAAPVQPIEGGLLVPAGPEVGSALLRRGGGWMLVLDAPLPLDLGPLRGTPFAAAQLSQGSQASVLHLPAAALPEPELRREAGGWRLVAGAAAPVLRSLLPEAEPGPPPRLLLRSGQAGGAVPVLDPESGGTLLVGTLRAGGEATPAGRRGAMVEMLPTRLGVALLPRTDQLTLRALPAGFSLSAGPGTALALGADPAGAAADAAAMSRLFDLPAEPLPALLQRERNATLAVAAAPALSRAAPRLRAAEALLALGLGAEAQAMAALARREDPRAAEDPAAQALEGAAALLAGRPEEAGGLLHPRLPVSDEAALWRGLLAAARGELPAAARGEVPAAARGEVPAAARGEAEAGAAAIAAALPLLLAYPEPLRARLLPPAAEALAAAEPAAARRLLAGREADPALALARARLLEGTGEAEAALAAYDLIARGRDRRARALALRRAAELRLATGRLDAAGAAAALDPAIAAWRGDALESDTRRRVAELRLQAGAPRAAFDLLRETEALFPALAPDLRARQGAALAAAIGAEPPVQAVALFDAHAALLPPGEAGEAAAATLAERLAALDLADRARAVLARALAGAAPEARARLGLRLAGLALAGGDAAGAQAALAETEAPGLPPALAADRALAEARALVRLGRPAGEAFRRAGPAAAPEWAEHLAAQRDWAGAAAVLRAHLDAALPPAPAPLEDAQRALLARLAALLALAGDEAGLAALRAAEAPRMEGGAMAEPFALLTAGSPGGIADLPRLRQELELARALPARLEALRAPPGAAR